MPTTHLVRSIFAGAAVAFICVAQALAQAPAQAPAKGPDGLRPPTVNAQPEARIPASSSGSTS
jgi:hypothetical protein